MAADRRRASPGTATGDAALNATGADAADDRAGASATLPAASGHPYDPDPHAHPGLHVIAVIEAAKGCLALLAASGLELLGPAPLQHWVRLLVARFQLDPDHRAMAWLANAINPGSVHLAAAVACLYGVLHVAEGWGLWRAKAWASWLGCVAAALYLPFDLYALLRHPGWLSAAVVAVNLLIVWVLARDLVVRRRRDPQADSEL